VLRWLSILVVALALVAAGCGGGDDESSASGDTTTTETVTEDTTTDETTDDTTTDESGDDTSSGSSGFPSEDCLQAATAFSALAAAAAGAQSSGDSSDALQNFEDFANEAPDEIKDDIDVLAAGYAAYLKVWNELGVEQGEQLSNDQIAKLAAASEAFNSTEFQAASANWDSWTTANCS
jgi:hypothetical protein